MTFALLSARLLLVLVFAAAGLSKLADREGSRRAIADFGAPKAFAAPLGLLLPLAELAVAATLIPASTALWGALGALALLLLFVAGIGANLARGNRPDCYCFGQLHSAPVGWSTLVRNGGLALVASFLVWQGWRGEVGPSGVGWLGSLSVAQLAGLIGGLLVLTLLAGQWWFLVGLLRQNGRILVRVEALEAVLPEGFVARSNNGTANGNSTPQPSGLPIGSQAPSFGLSGLFGETLTLDALQATSKPVMLLFTDPNCDPCSALLPEIERWQEEHAAKLTIALVSRGTAEENRAKSAEHGLTSVLLQEDWEVSRAYQVSGTPSAVLVHSDGTIGSPVVGGSEAIRSLVTQAVSGAPIQSPTRSAAQAGPCPNCGMVHPNGNGVHAAMPIGPKFGESAPMLKLPDLQGKTVNLAGFRGTETLVLFWNPGCGFCQRMLQNLKEWEASPPEGAPKLLVVSTGTKEDNQAMGLSSPVVLDQDFEAGRAFGASGTPCAVLVDAKGKIASEVVVGAPAVLELAGSNKAELADQ